MKKCISLVLALLMALALCSVSWADTTTAKYPDDVTYASFESAQTVYYTNYLGEVKSGGTVDSEKTALVAYVDASGNVRYAADVNAAIANDATTIYCKAGATLRMRQRAVDTNRTLDLTKDLTIYANGANFQYGEISVNMTDAGKAANVTVKVYDAKNIKVWGATPNDGVTQTFYLENCTNIGETATGDKGILMYITGNTGTVNATVKDCHIEKNSSGIYMSTNGSLTVTNTEFVGCAAGVKTSYKGARTRTDTITGCTFTNCGCDAADAGNTSWLADDSSAIKAKNGGTGTMTATIDNNTITGTKGGKGDIQVISETNTADVTVKNTAAKVTVSYKENNEQLVEEKTLTKDNTLTINENGGSNVTQPEQKPSNNYYYYAPSTDTTETKGSPKTFDAGVGIYAVTAVLSVTGMAWVGKKRH